MTRHAIALLSLVHSLSVLAHAEVVLVADRRAQCTIVLGKEARGPMAHSFDEGTKTTRAVHVPVLEESAEDLATHLNEIALIWEPGHKVRVVERKELARTKYRILLGSSAVEEYGLQEEAQSLSYPGYVYRTVGNDLLIFGNSPKGAANGIYGLLQDELGVRWFGPQELFRVLPEQRDISLDALDRRVEPSFPGRWYGVSGHQKHPAYQWARRRMRMAEMVDDGEPFANSSHYLFRIFRPALYAEKHPDYYPLRNGRRLKPDVQNWTPCLTNPGVIRVATRAALGAFRNPVRHSFSLGINDTGVFCQCEPCRKHSTGIEFRGRSDWQSDVYYWFVSQVAREVQKKHPGRYIGAIAYNNVTPPPKGAVAKNVHVVIVNDISEYFDRDYQKVDDELVQAWQAKGITLGLYYYMGLAKLVPAHFPHLIGRELKDKHRRGFTSMRCEVFPGWPWNGPQAYVAARLWWEVDLSVDDLLKDYFETLFGPAAEAMSRLYALFEEVHLRPRRGGFL